MGTCKDCRHWAGRPNVEDEIGTCRRFPPILRADNGSALTLFPVTLDTTTCGEFAARVLPAVGEPCQDRMGAAFDLWASGQDGEPRALRQERWYAFEAGYRAASGLSSPQES